MLAQLSQPQSSLTLSLYLLAFWGLPVSRTPGLRGLWCTLNQAWGIQNEMDSSQTEEEQIYKELYFTSQGIFSEQVQDSLVGAQPWGWEGGMGRLLYSLTWAEIDLHWSRYLSQELSKHNFNGYQGRKERGPCAQGAILLATLPLGNQEERPCWRSRKWPQVWHISRAEDRARTLNQSVPYLCPPGPERSAQQWVIDSHYPLCLFLSSLTILGSWFLDQQLEMSLVLLGKGNNSLGL